MVLKRTLLTEGQTQIQAISNLQRSSQPLRLSTLAAQKESGYGWSIVPEPRHASIQDIVSCRLKRVLTFWAYNGRSKSNFSTFCFMLVTVRDCTQTFRPGSFETWRRISPALTTKASAFAGTRTHRSEQNAQTCQGRRIVIDKQMHSKHQDQPHQPILSTCPSPPTSTVRLIALHSYGWVEAMLLAYVA